MQGETSSPNPSPKGEGLKKAPLPGGAGGGFNKDLRQENIFLSDYQKPVDETGFLVWVWEEYFLAGMRYGEEKIWKIRAKFLIL